MKKKSIYFYVSMTALSSVLLLGCTDAGGQKGGAAESGSVPPAASSVGQEVSGANSGDEITEEQAKEIGLKHAGLSEAEVVFARVNLDRENGRKVYDVEFHKDSAEYDYEIDAKNGDILSYDYDAESYGASSQVDSSQSVGNNDGYIGEAAAKEAALGHAGLAESEVTINHVKLDREDGREVYEVEFWKDRTEYDYEIDAASGEILSYDKDME